MANSKPLRIPPEFDSFVNNLSEQIAKDTGMLKNITGDVTGATCNVQIRNESYIVLDNFVMEDLGGGFYNATYNTSRIGKFFCRQNCTQGAFFAAETCDFVIEGDEKLAIAITLLLLFVISAYLVLVVIMSRETFSVHGAVKVAMLLLTK